MILVVFSVCVHKWDSNFVLAAHPFCSSLSINHVIRCFVLGIIKIGIEKKIKNKLVAVDIGYPAQTSFCSFPHLLPVNNETLC